MKAKRVDANQKEIVKQLRDMHCSVHITSSLGQGYPDICVGYKGINYLFEIKDGSKYQCQQKLTPDEELFHGNWKGQVDVIRCIDDVLDLFRKKS